MSRKNNYQKNMKKTLLIITCVLASFSITISSCSKEETKTTTAADPRDEAVGTYECKVSSFVLINNQLTPIDSSSTIFKIEKDANSSSIQIKELTGKLITTGSKIGVGSNGFTFDIEPQQINDTLAIEGYNYFSIGSTKYHGGYITTSKSLSFGYKISGKNIYVLTDGIKK
jgi:hypothetical protein